MSLVRGKGVHRCEGRVSKVFALRKVGVPGGSGAEEQHVLGCNRFKTAA